MYYVYILKSLKDNKYYIGQTKNVDNRLGLHSSGKIKSTKHRRPLKLIGYKTYKTRNEARWIEFNLKKHGDKKYRFIKHLEASGP